mgnify:CR=1 FL=1
MGTGWLALLAVGAVQALHLLVGYLSGEGSSFPQPLKADDEARYLNALHGSGPEATEARNLLIVHNLRLVAHLAKKYESSGEELDDLISIGTIGLIKGIETYEQGKGTKLATYAARCIENEILMYLRQTKKHRGDVSMFDPVGSDREGNEMTLLDVLQDDSEPVPDLITKRLFAERVHGLLGVLDDREREVLELRFGLRDGTRWAQRDVARRLGISRSYVSRIEKRAVERVKKAWNEGASTFSEKD